MIKIEANKKRQIQCKEFQGEQFIRFVPNKLHFQLKPVRASFLATPHLRHRGDGGVIHVSKEPNRSAAQ